MPVNVTVNCGLIVIKDGSSFLVTASDGSIDDNLAQGLFVCDTRLISYYEVYVNGYRLNLLASSIIDHHSALYHFTNPQVPIPSGTLPSGSLLVSIRRNLVGGMHEDIDITNYHKETIALRLMLSIRSDFAELCRYF
jgi:hypothetical protein